MLLIKQNPFSITHTLRVFCCLSEFKKTVVFFFSLYHSGHHNGSQNSTGARRLRKSIEGVLLRTTGSMFLL